MSDPLRTLDLVIPASRVVEHHLARVTGERDLLERLLQLSRDYERRRGQPADAAQARPAGKHAQEVSRASS